MSSAIYFNLDQSKILSSGYGLIGYMEILNYPYHLFKKNQST